MEFLDAMRHGVASHDGLNAASPDPTVDSLSGLRLADVLPSGPVGQHVVALLSRLEEQAPRVGYYAAMAEATSGLRLLRSLNSRSRRFVGDALHNIVRLLRRLRALASRAATETLRKPSAPQLYVIWLTEQLAGPLSGPLADRVDNPDGAVPPSLGPLLSRLGLSAARLHTARRDLADRLAQLGRLDGDAQIDALGESLSYPSWLVRSFVSAFATVSEAGGEAGGEAGAGLARCVEILRAQNDRAPLCVRVNPLRATREQAADRLRSEGLVARPTPMASCGLYLEGHANVYATQTFVEGWIELQDEGSQLIAEAVAPPPGGVVVDACAGAGGKTLALGALLANRGRILSIDVDRRKLDELLRRCRRAGLSNVQALPVPDTWTLDGGATCLPSWLRVGLADRVLVDAPCSGLGVLRRNPEARWRLSPGDLTELAATQARLLNGAAALVRPHGRLIYSTCTVLPQENQDIVQAFLASHPDFVPVPIKEIFGSTRARPCSDPDGLYLQTVPGPQATGSPGSPDGFFAAVLRRVR